MKLIQDEAVKPDCLQAVWRYEENSNALHYRLQVKGDTQDYVFYGNIEKLFTLEKKLRFILYDIVYKMSRHTFCMKEAHVFTKTKTI